MRTESFIIPSGISCTIRETNGADDDIISAVGDPSIQLAKYLAGIVISLDEEKRITSKTIQSLGIRDKYHILIKSRILSLGETLIFTQDWGPEVGKVEYAIDLREFIWDYTLGPIPSFGEEGYSDQRIAPYPQDPKLPFEGTTPSGLSFRMSFLNGDGESMMLKVPDPGRTINLKLKARNLEIFSNNLWMKVENFSNLSSRDMAYIRKLMEDMDPPIEGLAEIEHPLSRELVKVPLLGIQDFFFPVKIL